MSTLTYATNFEAEYSVDVEWEGDDEPTDDDVRQALQDALGFTGITVLDVYFKERAND